MDLIQWLKSKGGINGKCPSADTKALSFKECRYIGLISKNGRYLDELRDEAEWEGVILPHTTTDEFNGIIIDRTNGVKNTELSKKQLKKYDDEYNHHCEIEEKILRLENWLYNIGRLKNEKT